MNHQTELQSSSSEQPACPACGYAVSPEFRYCGACGARLDPALTGAAGGLLRRERSQPERRQLTVLFCDLVGSTRLANRLDPEEMRELILSYQAACNTVIRRFDGTISRYMGDGIRALFGYPRAHEDDAERAVRAGLDIVATISKMCIALDSGGAEALAVRIGIATGLVVAGDLIGEGAAEEEAIVGETPNLAARLQTVARENAVVIASVTRSLIGERFDCLDLGAHPLHGFADPVQAWRVRGPRTVKSRFEAVQTSPAAPLVGREEQLSRLWRLWRKAQQGQGRAVLLSGEAGIGKSRVVKALREQIATTSYASLRYQCSPHYINTALHPIVEHIERGAGIRHEDSPATKLAKFSEWLGPGPQTDEAVKLLGALLSLPEEALVPVPAMSPQRQKERTFELILWFMQRLAASRPVLIVFEDLHWVDPTTQEFLTLLLDQVRHMRALVILTCRPDFIFPWDEREHVERHELQRLTPAEALRLAQQVAGDHLPQHVVEQVVAKTDGVPLFVEELTRAVVSSQPAGELPEGLASHAQLPLLAIPFTLHDSLMARLDQLGPSKLIAQIAGAIGREFSYELLAAVAPFTAERLREGLQRLERAGLIYADLRAPAPRYIFKHALLQEEAYQSLLRSHRRELHLSIAEALQSRFPQTASDTPELLAHHWTEAGNVERAVAGWLAAGQRASERSEHREAIGHLRRGLELVPRLGDTHERKSRELALMLGLGPALIMAEGAGTPEVGRIYARALALCEGMPASDSHFAAFWGWWRASMDHRKGQERADELLRLARRLRAPALLLQAHHCQWATLYMLGAYSECCRHVEAGLDLYDPQRDHVHASLYGGHDARVCGLGEHALARWMLGQPQKSLGLAHSALAWSAQLGHVGSRAHAMDYALVLQKFRRDVHSVHLQAGELIAFAAEQKLRVFQAKGAFFRGWAHAIAYDVAEGLREMLEGIASERATDTPHDFTLYYEMLAEVYGRAGHLDDALGAVNDAFAVAERHGIVFWNAELHRRRGELLSAAGQRSAAEACFEEALACARSQQARSLELRAAVSLARLQLASGSPATASALLGPLYARFDEGLETPDLAEARQLLEAVR